MSQWFRNQISVVSEYVYIYIYPDNNSHKLQVKAFEKEAKCDNIEISRDLLNKMVSHKCENQDLIEFYCKLFLNFNCSIPHILSFTKILDVDKNNKIFEEYMENND